MNIFQTFLNQFISPAFGDTGIYLGNLLEEFRHKHI